MCAPEGDQRASLGRHCGPICVAALSGAALCGDKSGHERRGSGALAHWRHGVASALLSSAVARQSRPRVLIGAPDLRAHIVALAPASRASGQARQSSAPAASAWGRPRLLCARPKFTISAAPDAAGRHASSITQRLRLYSGAIDEISATHLELTHQCARACNSCRPEVSAGGIMRDEVVCGCCGFHVVRRESNR